MIWLVRLGLLLASIGVAHAQMGQAAVSVQPPAGGAAYQGPGDLVTGAAPWLGLRGYSAAFAATGTGKAVNYRRASDNSTQDGVILTSGAFDMATANTFAGPDGGTGVCTASTSGSSATLTISTCATSATLHAGDTLTCSSCVQPVYIASLGSFSGTGAGASGTVTLNAAQTISSQSVTSQVALFVTELYDQSGGTAHATQGTAGTQPQLLPLCLKSGTKPCVAFKGSQYLAATISTTSQPTSFSFVADNLVNANVGAMSTYVSGGNVSGFDAGGANTAYIYAGGTVSATAADGTAHSIQAVANGGSSAVNVDGSTTSGAAGSAGTSNTLTIGANGGGVNVMTGYQGEDGFYPSKALSGGDQSALQGNQKAYWGTP